MGYGSDMANPMIPDLYVVAALLGALGQSIRGGLGLWKRLRDDGALNFDPIFFVLSLGMGAVAGGLAALVYDLRGVSPFLVPSDMLWSDRNFILMTISAGYFGTDAIEGLLGGHKPKAR